MTPPPPAVVTASNAPAAATPLRAKLVNIFVCPSEVFEEIAASPHKAANWSIPTVLVSLTGVVSIFISSANDLEAAQARAAVLTVILATWIGTIWSALVLSFIGRVFLKVQFSFVKAFEVVALTAMILALGSVVTSLLVVATGDAAARPAPSLLIAEFNPTDKLHSALSALNFFHLWATTVLAAGLSKLSGVSFKEAAFWVLGYWLAWRLSLGWF